jgi:hypothetical protein
MGHKEHGRQQAQHAEKDYDRQIAVNHYRGSTVAQANKALGGRTHWKPLP